MTDFSVTLWVCWALQIPGSAGMPIDRIYKDAVPVGMLELPQLHS